jgi:pimeloyl-ACP methyl ester carboxylesterase
VLVGNSMGGMISILEAAAAGSDVRALVLLDPAVPGPRRRLDPRVALEFALFAVPGLGERFLRLRRRRRGTLGSVLDTLRLCGVDPATVPSALVDRSVALVDARQDVSGMDRAFLTAARSLLRVLADPRRYRTAMAEVGAPVLLVHGDRDRLVPVDSARDVAARNPGWRYLELPGVGHVPQLQVPGLLAGHLLEWLADVGVTASAARS